MRAEIRSWPMRTRTCQFHAAENLSRRRCTTSCDSMARTECTPAICPAIPRRTAVFACRNNMRLRCSMPSASALRLLYLAERRRDATWDNRNPHSCEAAIDSQTHGSARDLTRGSDHLRPRGGRETARSPLAVACAVLSAAVVHGAPGCSIPSAETADATARPDVIAQPQGAARAAVPALMISAGGLRATRKIDKIGQNIKRLVALGIDGRFFRIVGGVGTLDQIRICI